MKKLRLFGAAAAFVAALVPPIADAQSGTFTCCTWGPLAISGPDGRSMYPTPYIWINPNNGSPCAVGNTGCPGIGGGGGGGAITAAAGSFSAGFSTDFTTLMAEIGSLTSPNPNSVNGQLAALTTAVAANTTAIASLTTAVNQGVTNVGSVYPAQTMAICGKYTTTCLPWTFDTNGYGDVNILNIPSFTLNSSNSGGSPALCSAALTNTLVLCGATGPHQITLYDLGNASNAAVSFLQVFDAASTGAVTLGTTAPTLSFEMPANMGRIIALNPGQPFVNGVVIVCTTTRTGSTAPASTCPVNILGK